MRKAYKNIISLVVVLTTVLSISIESFAQDPFSAIAVGGLTGTSGAGLFGSMAGMSGIDIGWSQSGSDPMDAMWNVLNPDHVYFSGEKHEATGTGEDIYDYINVDIGDWLDAQNDFIKNFVNTNNVIDNSSGTVTGNIEFNGIPFVANPYSDIIAFGNVPENNTTVTIGSWNYSMVCSRSVYGDDGNIEFFYNGQSVGSRALTWGTGTISLRLYYSYGRVYLCMCYGTNLQFKAMSAQIGTANASVNVPWTSETVNTGVFDDWDSAKVKIPHSMSGLQTGWTLSDFLDSLNTIWSGAGEDNIVIENGGDVPPVPPQPIPDTPLGNVPFDDWIDLWGQGIYEQLENQSDALDFIGSNGTDAIEELESIDTSIQDLGDTAESIDTNIGVGNGILGGIRSLAQSAVDYLEGIAEYVGELVEEIVEGTETLIAGILNQIPQVFSVIFGPIKHASSIWHYVVEWIQSISAPMSWMWAMAGSASYFIQLPIYASLAGAVVLAFYKRFGK